jgi:hypothetical protein
MTVRVVLSIYFDIQPLLTGLYACTELQKTKSLLRNSCRLQLAIPLILPTWMPVYLGTTTKPLDLHHHHVTHRINASPRSISEKVLGIA